MAMKPQFTWLSAAATAVGNVRTHNEDSILDLPSVGLWAVADGMGGHQAGDTASRMVVEALAAVSRHERLSVLVDEVEDKLHEVNAALHRTAGGSGLSGTTVTVLLALRRHVLSLWAGDSRLYRSRGGQLEQLTRDHSDTQEMLDDGLISRDELAAELDRRTSAGVHELIRRFGNRLSRSQLDFCCALPRCRHISLLWQSRGPQPVRR